MYMYSYTRRIPLAFISPCHFPFSPPLCPLLLTWNPPSCDRNRPPRSQVACKLTPPLDPPLTQTLPLQIPRTPTAPRLTKTTSGIFRLLLSGTVCTCTFMYIHVQPNICNRKSTYALIVQYGTYNNTHTYIHYSESKDYKRTWFLTRHPRTMRAQETLAGVSHWEIHQCLPAGLMVSIFSVTKFVIYFHHDFHLV
jgi:hypothetical protein